MLFTGSLNMMNGILTPLLLVTSPLNPNTLIQQIRNHQSEQDRTPVQEMLNNTLEEFEDGKTEPPKSEELLQFPSYKDQPSDRWRHDRCHHRSWIRFIQERTGKNCGGGHSREEDKGSRRAVSYTHLTLPTIYSV